MTEANRRAAYLWYFLATSIVVIFLAFVWYMSPLGLGFATWPEANRDLLEHIYAGSYYVGIPAILITQVMSLVLFKYGNRKAAYMLPAASIVLFLTCIALILSNIN